MAPMPQDLHLLLCRHQPALKTAWADRLRAQPASSALAHPEILTHLMDTTLGQYGSLLCARSPARGLARHLASVRRLRAPGACRCGLNPLLTYFATGRLALDETLAALDGASRRRLGFAWDLLAQTEIGLLCSRCEREVAASSSPGSGDRNDGAD